MLQQVLHGMISNTLKMMRGITTIVLYTYILSTVSLPLFHLSIKHRFLLSFMYILISLSNNVIINYNFIVYSSPPSFYIFPLYLKLTSSFLPFIIFFGLHSIFPASYVRLITLSSYSSSSFCSYSSSSSSSHLIHQKLGCNSPGILHVKRTVQNGGQ